MAVNSQMVPLGTPAPDFDLPTIDGGKVALADLESPVVCVMFVCNHCPYVQHVEDELGRIADQVEDVDVVAICSNDPDAYPEDGSDGLREQAQRAGWDFPYAMDVDSSVGRAYNAVCTPDFFVYGPDRELVYRGAMDRSTPGNDEPNDGHELREALRLARIGEPVPEPHRPSMGCSIKWAD